MCPAGCKVGFFPKGMASERLSKTYMTPGHISWAVYGSVRPLVCERGPHRGSSIDKHILSLDFDRSVLSVLCLGFVLSYISRCRTDSHALKSVFL